MAGYARTCSADCPPGTLAWTGEHGENCSAAIAAGTQGSTLTVTDSLVRITGNAAYTCTNGSWVQGVTSCTATCPTELRSWGTLPQCMDKQLDGTTSPGTSAIIASSGTVTATAIYRCEGNGEWSLQTSVCLDSAAQASCPATVKAWTVGAYTCTAPVPLTDNGGSVTVVKTEGATLGRATFTCADGAWSTATDASCDNNCFVSISGSKTKDVVKITRSSDGGALWADLTCTFGANDKSYVCSSVPVIPDAQYLIRGRNSNGTFTGTVTLSSVGCGRSYTANLP